MAILLKYMYLGQISVKKEVSNTCFRLNQKIIFQIKI